MTAGPFTAAMIENMTDDEWLQHVADPETVLRFDQLRAALRGELLEEQGKHEELEDALIDEQVHAEELQKKIDELEFELEKLKL